MTNEPIDESEVRIRDHMQEFAQLEKLILEVIAFRTSVKDVELVMHVMTNWFPREFNKVHYGAILQSLVDRGEIHCLEFISPNKEFVPPDTKDRIRSIYFPKGTQFVPWHTLSPLDRK